MSKAQVPDRKYWIPDEDLPLDVAHLWQASNRPVLKPECLFFRESKPTFSVPEMTVGGWRLEHRVYYLWQGDGSLAVYTYLFAGSADLDGDGLGCLYVGCVSPRDWTLEG